MEEARTLAAEIAANPPHAVRMTKRLIRESRLSSLSTILEASASAQALCHTTSDHAEAVDAFFDKRIPSFTGS
jgi:enoyl-CoA hydratase/carnithine racemase